MDNVQIHAGILLTERLVAVAFLLPVLIKQVGLMRLRANSSLNTLRHVLFGIGLVIFIGQLVPILIDTAALLELYERSGNPNPLGLAYAHSNALTALLAAILLNLIYKVAGSSEK